MSEYMVCKGQFDDVEILKETLGEYGVGLNTIETHDSPVILHGWNKQDKTSKAEIVIRAGRNTNRYDIGFSKTEQGYVAIVNDMDKHSILGKAISDGSLLQNFCKNKILREVTKRRCIVAENRLTDEGKIRIVLSL